MEVRSSNKLVVFFFQSVIAAALFPIVVRSCGGDTRIAVWRLSLLLCSYFYSAVCVLCAPIRKARLLFFLTYPALFAFFVDAVLSHAIGAVIVYLESVLSAAMFGDVLAELSPSAAVAAENPHRAQDAQLADDSVFISAVVSAVAMCPLAIFVPDYPKSTLACIVVVSTILCLCLPLVIISALKPFIQQGGGERATQNVLACWYLLSLMLFILCFLLVSELGGVLLMWICVLALAVLLGYCLGAPATCFVPAHHEAQGEDGCTASQ